MPLLSAYVKGKMSSQLAEKLENFEKLQNFEFFEKLENLKKYYILKKKIRKTWVWIDVDATMADYSAKFEIF